MAVAGSNKYLQARIIEVLWKVHPRKIANEKKLCEDLGNVGEDANAVLDAVQRLILRQKVKVAIRTGRGFTDLELQLQEPDGAAVYRDRNASEDKLNILRALVTREPDALDIFELQGLVPDITPAYYLLMMLTQLRDAGDVTFDSEPDDFGLPQTATNIKATAQGKAKVTGPNPASAPGFINPKDPV